VVAVATATVGGRVLAISASEDESLRLWDLKTGEAVDDPLPTIGVVRAVATASSPDVLLVTAGYGVTTVQLAVDRFPDRMEFR
jgi:WD40 repeat protein